MTAFESNASANPYDDLRAKSSLVTSDDLQRRLDLILSRCRGRLDRETRLTCNTEATGEYRQLQAIVFRATARAQLGRYDFEKKRFPLRVFAELGRAIRLPPAPGWLDQNREPPVFQTYVSVPELDDAAGLRTAEATIAAEILFRFASKYQSVRDLGTVEIDLLGALVLGPEGRVLAASPTLPKK